MKRLFRQIIPARRYKRSLVGTVLSLIAVVVMINYLLKISQVAE
ncbi:MAG: hypothetical protein VW833_00670 [Candidatus Neomarinimicrobiota bacterium]|nr:hypothetical protein [Candidatus Neomarinimicrobiota bacterium]MEC8706148.1 hypothetical protein [Candidatus Neomarinimicrobiota bacterium]